MSPILPIETIARPACDGPLQQVAVGRGQREILAIGGADKIPGARADERPRDDAADLQLVAKLPRDAAELVEALETEGLLVRGDLEHGIGRGVADGLPRP